DVSAILRDSLQDDLTGSGKDQIAAALQAVAQDPLFLALLRETQAHRDAAYTDKGAKKTAKGSVFKLAAERLNETREERDKLQRIVSDSESVEIQLRNLTTRRAHKQEDLAEATRLVEELEKLAAQAADLSSAEEQIRLAKEEVMRIQRIGAEAELAECKVEELVAKVGVAEEALNAARAMKTEADAELQAAEETSRAEGPDPGVADTIVRQQLELRKSATDQAVRDAQQRIDAVSAAESLIAAASSAEQKLQERQADAAVTLESVSRAIAKLKVFEDKLRWCDLLQIALDVRAAGEETRSAQIAVDKSSSLQRRLEALSAELAVLEQKRTAIKVPASSALVQLRKLTRDLNAAVSALDVGFVVTVSPKARLDLRVRKDGQDVDSGQIAQPLDIEAKAEVELSIPDIATVRVRGGRREAQNRAQELQNRWKLEVEPHFIAADVSDLEGLEDRITQAQELDANIKEKSSEIESLRTQIGQLSGASERLRQATDREVACRAALGAVQLDTLAADITALGIDSTACLRKQREDLLTELAAARGVANQAEKDHTLAEERARQARSELDSARAAQDRVLTTFPEGVSATMAAARAALTAAMAEKENAAAEFASLEGAIRERKNRIDAALSGARAKASQAKNSVEAAQGQLTTAKTDHAAEVGRLTELRKQRDAENLAAAQTKLSQAVERHAALPVPDRIVTNEEVIVARTTAAHLKSEVGGIEREIQKTQGALEQVGGAVARERLRDATEAFELAERQ
ncbi:MAG: hypothetical protein JO251_24020, partial [Verrucomicrobia bacterium]|nr:hypothetical protein [Verrucomicrobiota bacterium]